MARSSSTTQPVIAITRGDPAGIGPEIVRSALRNPRLPRGFRYEVLGLEKGPGIVPGRVTKASARAALSALKEAAAGCRSGRFAAMVTGPVQKETLAQVHPGFVGQTEFLATACGLPEDASVMMLTDPKLTVALCTNHCSVREALRRLTVPRIVYVTRLAACFLRRRGIPKPRLALAAINPHGGENGLFGHEEKRLLHPAVKKLQADGVDIRLGPADTIFYHALGKSYDAVICPYHDQGLIPFKLVAFQTGVNVILGLPIIRTSPDHGTALDLAGRGPADHRSLLAALRLAAQLASAKDL